MCIRDSVYGADRFMERAVEAGVDALIVPDMPFEEREELLPACKAHGMTLIYLAAPTSSQRVKAIARETEGFVYCVSSLGVTGVRSEITTDVGAMVKMVKEEMCIRDRHRPADFATENPPAPTLFHNLIPEPVPDKRSA